LGGSLSVGGRGSRRVQRGGFASQRDASEELTGSGGRAILRGFAVKVGLGHCGPGLERGKRDPDTD